ncbi:MAG TPA: hypothetical protein DCP75_18955 [Haliea salexigens]|uniref:Uncharacterized protein n=1 Tax=Haliea salexigens TaxID=287487 RepID=A0A3C1KSX7_9GAMM|nr:hypothetical protein [Haliea sp.]HAN29757.1 hypothetical protein [Haliea salexigens]|tara:strand:+ start:325 stop:693 length:369 start_codon:yes stop_codon:yes gene_type:complete
MNVAKSLLAVLALGSSMAMAECVQPETPTLPNGGSATMDDMIAGQQAVKTFQAANLEYMACLETQFTAAKKTIEEGKAKDAESLKAAYEADVAAYNEAVSAEEALAGQFNTEIREFRAANPG